MDGSAAGGGAAAVVAILGILIRTGMRMDRQARFQQARQPRYTPPPPTARDPMLLTAAIRENGHPDSDVRQAAAAYLAGQLADAEYAALRIRLPGLYAPWPTPTREPQDAIPPEYQTGQGH